MILTESTLMSAAKIHPTSPTILGVTPYVLLFVGNLNCDLGVRLSTHREG
jgi:hypothetical protein